MYEDKWDRLWRILFTEDIDSVVYVYRVNKDGKMVKPYLLRHYAYSELPELLRDEYGGGTFKLLIRKRQKMIYSGEISIIESQH